MKTRTMTRQLFVSVFAMGMLAHAVLCADVAWSAPSCDSDSAVLKVTYEDIARGKILVSCNSETYKNPSVNDNGYPYSHRREEGALETHPENQGFVVFNLLGGGGDIESAWNVEKDAGTAKKFKKISCGTSRMCWVQDDADGTHYRVLKKDGTAVDFEGSLPASPPSGSVALVNAANDRQFVAADKFPTEVLDFELVYDGVDVKGFVPLLYRDSNGIARSSTPDSFPRVAAILILKNK